MTKQKKVGVISLGCDKNRVDTEKMLAFVSEKHQVVADVAQADVVIINTCSFLESSRKEAIEEIILCGQQKQANPDLKLIVTGCLPQRFLDQIKNDLPEVDAFMGVSDYGFINDVIDRICNGERVIQVGVPRGECTKKRVLTTDNYAYLKIADGCSNHCTYCLIPSIRGKFRSVPICELIEEVRGLGETDELILVAQDVAKYGQDLTPKTTLAQLIDQLSALQNVKKIRLLYCYPENITDELIDRLKNNDKLIKYIDVPFQHADDRVLKRMNRKGTGKSYLQLVKTLKKQVKGIAIRSTFITGFPGESEQAFDNLVEFLQKAKLFNAGFFKYSREQGTPAYKLDEQIKADVKAKRLRKLYSTQKKVVKENNSKFVGKTVWVKGEGFDFNQLIYYGRAYFNAPDIDGKVLFFSGDEVINGEYYKVKITKAVGYDLIGERI